jgi:hypothetical protein
MSAARMISSRRFTSAGPSGIAEKDRVHVRDYQFKGARAWEIFYSDVFIPSNASLGRKVTSWTPEFKRLVTG